MVTRKAPHRSAAARHASAPAAPTPAVAPHLYQSPEFLIRRAHQLASATFMDACKELDLTPSQYAALFTLRERGSLSQNELGRLISLDRSTMSVVVKTLRERRLVDALSDPNDGRKVCLQLTDAGRLVLGKAQRLSAASTEALTAALGRDQAQLLLALLQKLSDTSGMAGG